jgi:alpha,alpha-trehalase
MDPADVLSYIKNNWQRCIYQDQSGSGFGGVDLPYIYSSPCIKGEGKFYFFFYWDTYFTNVGLLKHGLYDVAKNNIRNMLWFIKQQGYMPNHVAIYNRSQPPYLCRMVMDYLAATDDSSIFAEAAEGLRQEYHFWTTARHTPTGLQRHGHHATAKGCEAFYSFKRVLAQGNPPEAPRDVKVEVGGQFLAEAETGWDFTQRFNSRCLDYNAVDLNGLLHDYELFLLKASAQLGWGDEKLWESRAQARRELTTQLLWNDSKGWFFDYNFVTGQHSEVWALSGMLPLFSGLATQAQAERARQNLHVFEREHGIAVTEDRPGCRNYQWAYPNMWPPMVYVSVQALRRYGFEGDARRIAKKYVDTTVSLFEKTGQLWEKTEADTGRVAGGEYEAAPMLGWSAGVFIAMHEFIEGPLS